MTTWVYSGRPSEGAALLAQQPGFKRSRTGNYIKPNDVIINWGHGGDNIPHSANTRVLNRPEAVMKAINKRTTFEVLSQHNVPTVPWTTDRISAGIWLNQGHTVFARKTLTGHEGAGIIVVEPGNELIQAPLYTKYIKKIREFRVHATSVSIIDTQWKVHDSKLGPPKSWKIRSYNNGFIFQRKGVIPNAQRDALAIQAVKALGLDFGGLDIIEDNEGNFYVVEINTAPGIEGTTVSNYAKALSDLATGNHGGYVPNPAPAPAYYAPKLAGPGPGAIGVHNFNLGWAD